MQSEPGQMEVDNENGASDGSTSDSDGSEFEELDISMEDMANITKLETELEANPNIYDVHLQVHEHAWPSSGLIQTLLTPSLTFLRNCHL